MSERTVARRRAGVADSRSSKRCTVASNIGQKREETGGWGREDSVVVDRRRGQRPGA